MMAGGLALDYFIVAVVAELMAGEFDIECGGFLQGGSAIMTELSKIIGNEAGANGNKHNDDDRD
jgi:hypothetical protein